MHSMTYKSWLGLARQRHAQHDLQLNSDGILGLGRNRPFGEPNTSSKHQRYRWLLSIASRHWAMLGLRRFLNKQIRK